MVNALVHRDYVMSGADIKVAVYDSRIEITSPGAFPRGITLAEVLDGRSEVRNKVVARVFKEAELIEQWGRGIQKMNRLCVEAGLKKPDITEAGMFVQVTFYRNNESFAAKVSAKAMDKKDRTKKPDEKTADSEKKLLAFVLERGEITASEGMDLLSLGKSRTAEILGNLLQKRILVREGLGRATYYKKGPEMGA